MAEEGQHEQQLHDEVIAAGEHMDLDAQAEALDAEKKAGVTNPTGVVLPSLAGRMNPYLTEEDQDMEMEPKVFGPPQYGSPDPATSAGRLMPLEDGHPLEGLPEGHPAAISEDFAAAEAPAGAAAEGEVDATEGAVELANEEEIDLSTVEGSGKDGRITKEDVQAAVDARDEESN